MTDADILEMWNAGIEARDEFRRSLTYVATELPVGRPRLERSAVSGELTMRGQIVRCVLQDPGPP
jgi:hypothetical protein